MSRFHCLKSSEHSPLSLGKATFWKPILGTADEYNRTCTNNATTFIRYCSTCKMMKDHKLMFLMGAPSVSSQSLILSHGNCAGSANTRVNLLTSTGSSPASVSSWSSSNAVSQCCLRIRKSTTSPDPTARGDRAAATGVTVWSHRTGTSIYGASVVLLVQAFAFSPQRKPLILGDMEASRTEAKACIP